MKILKLKNLFVEAPGDDLEKSYGKDPSSFRSDLEGYMSDTKVKAVLAAGLADGDPDDDKMPYSKANIAVKGLTPTQNEIGFDQSIKGNLTDEFGSLAGIFKGTPDVGGPIVTYAGKYIIDGHHRWSTVFAVNPNAKMAALDIKSKSGFEATDVLKAVHSAIAVDRDKVPSADPKGINILAGIEYNDVLKAVNAFLSDKAKKIWKYNNFKSNEAIAKHLTDNLNNLGDPVSGAPGRKDMPQTDADKTAPIDKLNALAKGYINVAAPFVKDGYKATGNMLKEHFQRIARIKSKK